MPYFKSREQAEKGLSILANGGTIETCQHCKHWCKINTRKYDPDCPEDCPGIMGTCDNPKHTNFTLLGEWSSISEKGYYPLYPADFGCINFEIKRL
jgi:hypothetical protein